MLLLSGLHKNWTNLSRPGKYVNMADVTSAQGTGAEALSEQETVALIELMFFAYRDFVSDPDEILGQFGFGRAHHRVLHFVGRDPGMTVQQLLDILQITKQSLGRVLTLGVTSCTITSLVFLPAVLRMLPRREAAAELADEDEDQDETDDDGSSPTLLPLADSAGSERRLVA